MPEYNGISSRLGKTLICKVYCLLALCFHANTNLYPMGCTVRNLVQYQKAILLPKDQLQPDPHSVLHFPHFLCVILAWNLPTFQSKLASLRVTARKHKRALLARSKLTPH